MNVTDWNAIADAYSEIDDPEGRAVLTFIRDKLATLRPKRLLDYGGGDGKFAVLCAETLPLQEIVTYDPAPRMTSLARSLCADFKQIRVSETIEEIESGIFDVVTFNGVWMCLASREACLDVLSDIARLLRSDGRLVASVDNDDHALAKNSVDSSIRTYVLFEEWVDVLYATKFCELGYPSFFGPVTMQRACVTFARRPAPHKARSPIIFVRKRLSPSKSSTDTSTT